MADQDQDQEQEQEQGQGQGQAHGLDIFHSGTIESAIGAAITGGRSLACFITDGSDESTRWENAYLRDPEAISAAQRNLVLVKLAAGSVEAGFLAAFCPIQAVPYLVIIKNGALVANVAAGATEAEVIAAMKTAPETVVPAGETVIPAVETVIPAVETPQATAVDPTPVNLASGPSSTAYTASPPPARRPSSTPDPTPRSNPNTAYLEAQRKRQAAALEERTRVLRLLENDKIERRQARRQSTSTTTSPSTTTLHPPPHHNHHPSTTSLSIRLLDGTSLKHAFPSTAQPTPHIRAWLDAHRTDSDHPYSFLQILAPRPNRALTLSDEGASLALLGLAPTATLVLVPARGVSTAYSAAPQVGWAAWAYAAVGAAVRTVLGVGYPAAVTAVAAAAVVDAPAREGVVLGEGAAGGAMSRSSSAQGGRVRTLYDRRESQSLKGEGEGERKYYNGNQLDFEPKPKLGEGDGDGDGGGKGKGKGREE